MGSLGKNRAQGIVQTIILRPPAREANTMPVKYIPIQSIHTLQSIHPIYMIYSPFTPHSIYIVVLPQAIDIQCFYPIRYYRQCFYPIRKCQQGFYPSSKQKQGVCSIRVCLPYCIVYSHIIVYLHQMGGIFQSPFQRGLLPPKFGRLLQAVEPH